MGCRRSQTFPARWRERTDYRDIPIILLRMQALHSPGPGPTYLLHTRQLHCTGSGYKIYTDSIMDSDINNRAPGPEWTYYYGKWVVGGERESFLLASIAPGAVTSPDVAPLGNGELSAEDSSKLESQGIPADCQDDVSIVRARISLDRDLHLSREEISTDENELTCDYVLRELRGFLDHLEKPGGRYN